MTKRRKPYPSLLKRAFRRVWLNESRAGGSAHIIWSVEPPTFSANDRKNRKPKDPTGWISGPYTSLEIADCNRKVSLEFDDLVGGDAQATRKIDRMIRQLQDFRAAMLGALERRKELKLKHPGARS